MASNEIGSAMPVGLCAHAWDKEIRLWVPQGTNKKAQLEYDLHELGLIKNDNLFYSNYNIYAKNRPFFLNQPHNQNAYLN